MAQKNLQIHNTAQNSDWLGLGFRIYGWLFLHTRYSSSDWLRGIYLGPILPFQTLGFQDSSKLRQPKGHILLLIIIHFFFYHICYIFFHNNKKQIGYPNSPHLKVTKPYCNQDCFKRTGSQTFFFFNK